MHRAWKIAVGELGSRPVPLVPPWPSGISDDQTPIEFSLVLDPRAPELRLLWEPQGASGLVPERVRVARETFSRLDRIPGIWLRRLRALEPLFLRESAEVDFVAWHGARLWPAGPADFKVYFNPAAQGREHVTDLVEEAMSRVGLESSWRYVRAALTRPGVDEIRYISLDLRRGRGTRFKAYIYHPDATADQIAAAGASAPVASERRLRAFFEVTTGGRSPEGSFCPGTCLSFVEEGGPEPIAATLHVPVRGYVESDAEVTERVEALAETRPGLDRPLLHPAGVALHQRAVAALATRSLDSGVGLTTYLSLRSQGEAERVTAYLATECYGVEPARVRRAPP